MWDLPKCIIFVEQNIAFYNNRAFNAYVRLIHKQHLYTIFDTNSS